MLIAMQSKIMLCGVKRIINSANPEKAVIAPKIAVKVCKRECFFLKYFARASPIPKLNISSGMKICKNHLPE